MLFGNSHSRLLRSLGTNPGYVSVRQEANIGDDLRKRLDAVQRRLA
jgi:hypothetical protein